MNLIPVQNRTIGQVTVQTVNARELHSFLESKQQYGDWIKNRIAQYGFAENVGYVVFHNSMKNPESLENKGGRPTKVYFVTISCAKELAMVERTAKGREARLYFIECERRYMARIKTSDKYVNNTITHLLENTKLALTNQQHLNNRLIKLQEQCLNLQSQTLVNQNHLQVLMEKIIDSSNKRNYRTATKDDIPAVKSLLEKGYTYNQISTELGISPYIVARIKQGRFIILDNGNLKAADQTTKTYS